MSQTLARFQHVVFSEVNTFPPPMPIPRQESGHLSNSMPSPVSLVASPSTPHATVDLKNDPFSRSYQNTPRFPRDILCDRDRDNTRYVISGHCSRSFSLTRFLINVSANSSARLYDNESDSSHSDEEHQTRGDNSSRSYSYTNPSHSLPYRSAA